MLGESEFQRNTSSSSSSGGRESFGQAEFRRSSSFDDLDFKTPGGWGAHRKPVAAQVQEKKAVSREEKTGGEQAGRVRALAVVGGVAANQELRRRLQVGRERRAGAGRRSPRRPPSAIFLFAPCRPYAPHLHEKGVPIQTFSVAEMPPMRGRSLFLARSRAVCTQASQHDRFQHAYRRPLILRGHFCALLSLPASSRSNRNPLFPLPSPHPLRLLSSRSAGIV